MSCCVACSEVGELVISDRITVHYDGKEMVVMESVKGKTRDWDNEIIRIPVSYCSECGGRLIEDANL